MNKTEATAVNVLLTAIGVRTDQAIGVSPDAVTLAVHLIAAGAFKAIGAGVRPDDVNAWASRQAVIPSLDLFDSLEELRALDADVWTDQASAFSCREADTFATFLAALDRDTVAAEVMAVHTDVDCLVHTDHEAAR